MIFRCGVVLVKPESHLALWVLRKKWNQYFWCVLCTFGNLQGIRKKIETCLLLVTYYGSFSDPIKLLSALVSLFQEPKTWLPVSFQTQYLCTCLCVGVCLCVCVCLCVWVCGVCMCGCVCCLCECGCLCGGWVCVCVVCVCVCVECACSMVTMQILFVSTNSHLCQLLSLLKLEPRACSLAHKCQQWQLLCLLRWVGWDNLHWHFTTWMKTHRFWTCEIFLQLYTALSLLDTVLWNLHFVCCSVVILLLCTNELSVASVHNKIDQIWQSS